MNQPDTTNQSDSRKKSTGVWIAGVVAVLLIGAAFYANDLSGTRKSELATMADRRAEDVSVLKTDMLLHSRFARLQELDEEYGILIYGSAPDESVDSINRLLEVAENDLAVSIDSVKKRIPDYKAYSNVLMLDSISNAFTIALSNRKYIADIRSSVTGKKLSMAPDQKRIMELESQLRQRDGKIALLQRSVTAPAAATAKSPTIEADKEELQNSLKEEEIRNAGLLDIINNMKVENQHLTAEVNEAKKTAIEATALTAARKKMQSLEQEVEDMEAALSFARIDCSLSRADANKIISNSRQRRELLEEALKTLQLLAASDNASVKQKAKEKIGQLNQIASTVRD